MTALEDQLTYGTQLHRQGRLAEAERVYRDVLAAHPRSFDALNLLSMVAAQSGRDAEALELTKRAIAIDPTNAQAHNTRANAFKNLKRFAEAVASYDRALALDPGFFPALTGRAFALANLERFDDALTAYDDIVARRPDYAEAHAVRGNILMKQERFTEAIEAYETSLALKPQTAEAHCNLGLAHRELMQFDAARANYAKAIERDPDYAEAWFSQATLSLLTGDFTQGWPAYEKRKLRPETTMDRRFTQLLWLGETPIAGKRILVHHEQGLGDTIQFCRYVAHLEAAGAEVLFAPQPALVQLLRTLDVGAEFVTVTDAIDADVHCPILSLPLACGTDLATIPDHVPYLRAEPARIAKWRERIGSHGFRIGICWQGTPGKVDAGRSFPVTMFRALAALPNVRLISLHKGSGETQLAGLPQDFTIETLGPDFDAGSDAFLDTAAAMAVCDLVITSDTAVAHLAGALARPVWIVLKQVPDWRWLLDRSDTPWYPTARLYRQTTHGDWTAVFRKIERDVREMVPPA